MKLPFEHRFAAQFHKSKFLSEQQGLGNVNLKLHEMRVGLVHG
jgi:hypothetical protein